MTLKISTKSWWEADSYPDDSLMPLDLSLRAGPKGAALVRVNDNGTTQAGWGLTGKDGAEGFMPRYNRGEFAKNRAEYGYRKGAHPVALVMRAFQVVAIDIDGKNGGLKHASELGVLPATLAETSKSGNGFHLFYATNEPWDPVQGYDAIPDQIGIVTGVDIRGTGCIYHHDTQRWNNRPIAMLPQWLEDRLLEKKTRVLANAHTIQQTLTTLDETEILLMHANILQDLAKKIPAGKRNNTLFAIGSQLKQAEAPDWQKAIYDRAIESGLDSDEAEKIVSNIENYGV